MKLSRRVIPATCYLDEIYISVINKVKFMSVQKSKKIQEYKYLPKHSISCHNFWQDDHRFESPETTDWQLCYESILYATESEDITLS